MAIGHNPTEFLRNLGLFLERIVEPRTPGERARIAAQGAVAGISEQVQTSVPELRAEDVEHFVVDLVTVLDHLVGGAAKHLEEGGTGSLSQHVAQGVARGLLDELSAAAPELQPRLQRLAEQAEAGLQQLRQERHSERSPGERGYRARVMGEGAVRGAASELKRQLPDVERALSSLGPASGQLVARLVRQAVSALVEDADEVVAAVELVSEGGSRTAVRSTFAELEEQLKRAKSEGVADAAFVALEHRVGEAAAAMVHSAVGAMVEEARRRQLGPRAREAIARGSRAAAEGALDALKQQLHRPLLWSAGIGAAVGLTLLARRARARH